MVQLKFLDKPPRFLFFTGKGGVGKTTLTAANLAGAFHHLRSGGAFERNAE